MFTATQMHELHEDVFNRMLKAGWLQSFNFTEGVGWDLAWTAKGTGRSARVKDIAISYGLADDDGAPAAFDVLCHGEALPDDVRPVEIEDAAAADWRDAVQELDLRGNEHGLRGMVHASVSWAPEEER